MIKTLFATAAACAALSTGAANAAFLDLTTDEAAAASSTNPFALVVDGITITITSAPVAANFNDTVDPSSPFCQSQGGAFACENDGLGIRDDEVGAGESVTLDFSRAVNVTSLSFLDLFINPDMPGEDETVVVMVNGMPAIQLDALIDFTPGGTGFAQFATDLGAVTSLTLLIGEGNDGVGNPDFALAGLEFSPVPVPGAALLFGTAMVGGAAVRRRRKTA